MARKKSTSIRRELGKLIPKKRLAALAEESGAVTRHRKVDIVPLFWTLVLGFGAAKERTLAGLPHQPYPCGVEGARDSERGG